MGEGEKARPVGSQFALNPVGGIPELGTPSSPRFPGCTAAQAAPSHAASGLVGRASNRRPEVRRPGADLARPPVSARPREALSRPRA